MAKLALGHSKCVGHLRKGTAKSINLLSDTTQLVLFAATHHRHLKVCPIANFALKNLWLMSFNYIYCYVPCWVKAQWPSTGSSCLTSRPGALPKCYQVSRHKALRSVEEEGGLWCTDTWYRYSGMDTAISHFLHTKKNDTTIWMCVCVYIY